MFDKIKQRLGLAKKPKEEAKVATKPKQKKVLICTPTSHHKDYCLTEWVDNISKILKNCNENNIIAGIMIVDNSPDPKHFLKILDCFKSKGLNNLIYVKSHYHTKVDLLHLMSECNNICRDFFLEKKIDYMMSIESDIFPPENVITDLLCKCEAQRPRPIIGYPYFLGYSYKPHTIWFDIDNIGSVRLERSKTAEIAFNHTDGKLHEAIQIGLGCCIIPRYVLENISFDIKDDDKSKLLADNTMYFADSHFFSECHKVGVNVFIDTSVWVHHQNGNWSKINNKNK